MSADMAESNPTAGRYRVADHIRVMAFPAGPVYTAGDVVTLDDEQAQRLSACGAVVPAKADPQPDPTPPAADTGKK